MDKKNITISHFFYKRFVMYIKIFTFKSSMCYIYFFIAIIHRNQRDFWRYGRQDWYFRYLYFGNLKQQRTKVRCSSNQQNCKRYALSFSFLKRNFCSI